MLGGRLATAHVAGMAAGKTEIGENGEVIRTDNQLLSKISERGGEARAGFDGLVTKGQEFAAAQVEAVRQGVEGLKTKAEEKN
jgi:hypothetical protein